MSVFKEEERFQSDTKRFLEFNLGSESYAVELSKVKEVITLPELTPIPKSPPYVCGLMNLRGLVLTVIDLRKKLGITPIKDTSQNGVIIFDLGERLVGVMVDSIQKVLNMSPEQIKPVPESENESSAYIIGILQQEKRLSMWLDPAFLLESINDLKKVS
jgi:purine-binding chemotaxis protein CheW